MLDQELLVEKDQTIQQLKETIEILELKVKKLEQLVKLKDAKILNLSNKLQTAGIMQWSLLGIYIIQHKQTYKNSKVKPLRSSHKQSDTV